MDVYRRVANDDGSESYKIGCFGCLASLAALFFWGTTAWLLLAALKWLFGGDLGEGDMRALIVWLGSVAVIMVTSWVDYIVKER